MPGISTLLRRTMIARRYGFLFLRNRSRQAWRKVRELRMEYHLKNGHTVADVKNALAELDFSITRFSEGPNFGTLWATNRAAQPQQR